MKVENRMKVHEISLDQLSGGTLFQSFVDGSDFFIASGTAVAVRVSDGSTKRFDGNCKVTAYLRARIVI